jgi:hypothetical protein
MQEPAQRNAEVCERMYLRGERGGEERREPRRRGEEHYVSTQAPAIQHTHTHTHTHTLQEYKTLFSIDVRFFRPQHFR